MKQSTSIYILCLHWYEVLAVSIYLKPKCVDHTTTLPSPLDTVTNDHSIKDRFSLLTCQDWSFFNICCFAFGVANTVTQLLLSQSVPHHNCGTALCFDSASTLASTPPYGSNGETQWDLTWCKCDSNVKLIESKSVNSLHFLTIHEHLIFEEKQGILIRKLVQDVFHHSNPSQYLTLWIIYTLKIINQCRILFHQPYNLQKAKVIKNKCLSTGEMCQNLWYCYHKQYCWSQQANDYLLWFNEKFRHVRHLTDWQKTGLGTFSIASGQTQSKHTDTRDCWDVTTWPTEWWAIWGILELAKFASAFF